MSLKIKKLTFNFILFTYKKDNKPSFTLIIEIQASHQNTKKDPSLPRWGLPLWNTKIFIASRMSVIFITFLTDKSKIKTRRIQESQHC